MLFFYLNYLIYSACTYSYTVTYGKVTPEYNERTLQSGETICISNTYSKAFFLLREWTYSSFLYEYYGGGSTSSYSQSSSSYGGYYSGSYSGGTFKITASSYTTIKFTTSYLNSSCNSFVATNIDKDVFSIGRISSYAPTPDFTMSNSKIYCYINHKSRAQNYEAIINTEKTYDFLQFFSPSASIKYSGSTRFTTSSSQYFPKYFIFNTDPSTLSSFVNVRVTSSVSSSTYGLRLISSNVNSASLISYGYSSSFYDPPSATSSASNPDYSDTITGLSAAISFYMGLIVILLMLNAIAACMHPNRMYRTGCTCYCCYCCCTDHYYYSGTYYSSRPAYVGGCGNCGDCGNCGGGGGNNDALAVVFLVIILVILICIAFILMYTLYQLCTSDEDESRWEASQFNNSSYAPHKPEQTQSFMPNVVPQNPPPPPQVINQNVYAQPYPNQPYPNQPYPNQPYVAQPYVDPNYQNVSLNNAVNPYDDYPPPK